MTAFARQEEPTSQGDLTWEIRSVNHRYLESSLLLDERFRPLEMKIKKLFSRKLARGKVDASLRYTEPEHVQSTLNIDELTAQAVIEQCEHLSMLTTRSAPIDMLRVLQWPGVLQAVSLDHDALNQAVMRALEGAIDELIVTRETEGAVLEDLIEQRCHEVNQIIVAVRVRMPEILEHCKIRLVERVAAMQVNLDPERLEQEMVMLAQKSDVAEELDRLQSHVNEVLNVLKRDEPTGRRLDFLMQELNREANTLGSKSISTDTTRYCVDLKVLIEQMREQIQNIE